MKQHLKPLTYAGVAALLLATAACKKDDTDNVSVVRTYPLITLNGPTVSIVQVGSSYTDPGVTATLGGQAQTPRVTGSVNTAAQGVYTIRYSARNPEGDSVFTLRSVAVIDTNQALPDLSGSYVRTATGGISMVTKVRKGLYITDNLGAVPAPSASIFPAYFVQTSPTTIDAPIQMVPGLGVADFDSESLTLSGNTVVNFKWAVYAQGFGTAVRTFQKQ